VDVLDVVQIKLIILGRESELTIVDDTLSDDYPDGKPVTIKKPVNRIIPFSGVEELRTLKAKDKIVGIGDYTAVEEEFFPDISQLPTCGSGFYPDVEKILSLDPDIVISVGGEYTSWTADLEDDLKGTNVILIRLDFYQPHNMAEDIRQLGYIVDKKAEAEEFVDWHDGYMNTIYERVEGLSEDEKPKIYNEASPWHTYTKHSGWTMPGGIDMAADLSEAEYVEVEPEWVVAQNPDIIFKQVWGITGYTVDDASGVEAARDEVMSRLAGVTAVTEGKVYCMDMDTTCKVYGHAYCAKWIQPELFEDLDPQAIHEEYLERFQGIPYQGIWVYPPLE
jgi:iron complex transport system substrate-binding protein